MSLEYSPQQKNEFMQAALTEAQKAGQQGEVPIGCVVVDEKGQIIGRGHNQRESSHDVTAHAEIKAIRQATTQLGDWRLESCSLFVTLEPCPMCAGAIVNSRISQVYYGSLDLKAGCAGTLMNLLTEPRFNHQVQVEKGICQEQCEQILSEFFAKIRQNNKKTSNLR